MGYFTNAFVLGSPPDSQAIAAALPGWGVRGYKHLRRELWLLDVWEPEDKPRRREAFCEIVPGGFRLDDPLAQVDAPTHEFLRTLEEIMDAVGRGDGEVTGAHMTLALAAANRVGVFYYAADDTLMDMGCLAVPGSLVRFSCHCDERSGLSVRYSAGKTHVALDDPDDDDLFTLVAKIRGVDTIGFAELPPGKTRALYANALETWPPGLGDPKLSLGLGTWDPLANLDTDFHRVFQRFPK